MFAGAQYVGRLFGINTENTEKPTEMRTGSWIWPVMARIQNGIERPISLLLSVILCGLCVALLGVWCRNHRDLIYGDLGLGDFLTRHKWRWKGLRESIRERLPSGNSFCDQPGSRAHRRPRIRNRAAAVPRSSAHCTGGAIVAQMRKKSEPLESGSRG